MNIDKKIVTRKVGDICAYKGYVREVPLEVGLPVGEWQEATVWITKDDVREAAPAEEVKDFCKKRTSMYAIENGYSQDDQEEFF